MNKLTLDNYPDNDAAKDFCDKYLAGTRPRYVLGRNEFAKSISSVLEVDGFIDDFTTDSEYIGLPIVKIGEVPKNALVISTSTIRPFSAQRRLAEYCLEFLDYFAFRRYAGLKLVQVNFEDKFKEDFQLHEDKYMQLYDLLSDDESKANFTKIVNFRLSQDLSYLRGFEDLEDRQYFEDFLRLEPSREVFVDVGSYDGYTSACFIKQCPAYKSVHVFEPETSNMLAVKKRLAAYPHVYYYPYGLSNRTQTLRFEAKGSASRISEHGDMTIRLERLDDVLTERFTYLKMDVEGAEMSAIEGAEQSIIRNYPRLAISAYHRFDDFWRILEKVLSYRDDYRIFLRHYTEGITETVMFFIPKDVGKKSVV